MSYTAEELLEFISHRLDSDEILDILDMDPDELVEALAEHILQKRDVFLDRLDLEDY